MRYFAEIQYVINGKQGRRFTTVVAENEKVAREHIRNDLRDATLLDIDLTKLENNGIH